MQWDARLVSQSPFELLSFEELVKRRYISPDTTMAQHEAVMRHYTAISGVQVRRIVYKSDGLSITGAMLWPENPGVKRHPLLIYNRGGSGPFGVLTASTIVLLSHYAALGYLVFASNYRGNDGSEGSDEFGGADVDDVLALMDIARNHPSWDGKNTFMYGHSRGGMMTYLALKRGAALNAAIAVAAPSQLNHIEERPDMISIYRRYIPGFDADPSGTLHERCASEWPEKLRAPLLLIHGDADDRVRVSHTTLLDEKLTALGMTHKTVIYPGSNHYMSGFRMQTREEITRWLEAHSI